MNKQTHKYLKHLKKLHYSEYAHLPKTTDALVSGYRKNEKNNNLDFELLDLSLGQNDIAFRELYKSTDDLFAKAGQYTISQNENILKLLANKENVSSDNILLTSGCDGALDVLSRMFIHEGIQVCIPLPSFPRYEYHAKVNQGKIIFIPPGKFPYHIDMNKVENMYSTKSVDVTFIANPNNPTGNYIQKADISRFLKSYKGILILDEALILTQDQSCTSLLKKFSNLIIVKSFSKVYGLAGMRVGYIIANKEIIDLASKLISPFEISSISLSFAETALQNENVIKTSIQDVQEAISILRNHNFPHVEISPTEAPTAIVESKNKDNLYYKLLKNGVKTISCKSFRGLRKKNCVRISIKNKQLISRLIEILDII